MAIKKKDHENLTDANIAKVIGLLEHSKPITKKEACETLNIAYNTTRLNNIIEAYKTKKATNKKLREAKRGKPASKEEIAQIVEEHLQGETITYISQSIYRSTSFIKSIIEKTGVPKKSTKEEKSTVAILPDQCVATEFVKGEVVWSAKYHSACEILRKIEDPKYNERYGCDCYAIYVFEPIGDTGEVVHNMSYGGFNAYAPAYDLGSLKHLQQYDIKFKPKGH